MDSEHDWEREVHGLGWICLSCWSITRNILSKDLNNPALLPCDKIGELFELAAKEKPLTD